MKDLQKHGVVPEEKVSINKFYEILCLYKDKGDVYPFEVYSCTFLDHNTMITFVNPDALSLVKRCEGDIRSYKLTFDDTFKLLNPYLRKYKIEKINGKIS